QNKKDNLAKAAHSFEKALSIYTHEDHPVKYSEIKNKLDTILQSLTLIGHD
ncbi:MAG: hypothetical protein HQK97_13385, partial [Nitrospirae bacterium]|nr:hypothetical protein [Nitrospirota bacterium]